MVRVLVAESDPVEAWTISGMFRRHGFEVAGSDTALSAVAAAPRADLVVLGLCMPDLDGLETCRRIRAASGVPIIGTSLPELGIDLVTALRAGLDAFLARPFGLRELVARAEAILRRTLGREAGREPTSWGPLRIDVRTREVRRCGERIQLTRKEFDLLHLLAGQPDTLFSRQQIMSRVWGDEWAQSDRTIDTHVSSLRGKLGDPTAITTVRGVGFRIGYQDSTTARDPEVLDIVLT